MRFQRKCKSNCIINNVLLLHIKNRLVNYFLNLHKIQGTFYTVSNTSVNEDGSQKQTHTNY